jgi:hypothetical protein
MPPSPALPAKAPALLPDTESAALLLAANLAARAKLLFGHYFRRAALRGPLALDLVQDFLP